MILSFVVVGLYYFFIDWWSSPLLRGGHYGQAPFGFGDVQRLPVNSSCGLVAAVQ
jgi:hypothetical protein